MSRTILYWGTPNRLAVAVQSSKPGTPNPNLGIAVFDAKRKSTVDRLLNAAHRHGFSVSRTRFRFDPTLNAGSVTPDNELLTAIFGRNIVQMINDENQLQREANKRQARNAGTSYPAPTWSHRGTTSTDDDYWRRAPQEDYRELYR